MKPTPAFLNRKDTDNLPGILGIQSIEIGSDYSIAEMTVHTRHMNLKAFIHGGSVVALADTAAGYGCYANLPEGANGFTTIELKCNFIGSTQSGVLRSTARCIHRGKTTQVWDADVVDAHSGRTLGEFRCTQLITYPSP
ncbi:MAG: PaaI family thioesterase [Gammaproteobacteria bacterium]|nr:PaaI family thioesterase [Gammaproteobacteria bacterium]